MEQWSARLLANFNNYPMKKQTMPVVFFEKRDKRKFSKFEKCHVVFLDGRSG